MPQTKGQADTGALITEIRGYLQRGEMDYQVAMGLTLTSMVSLLEAFEVLRGHTHPELKQMTALRKWGAGILTAIVLGALGFIWGVASHQIIVTFVR